LRLDNRFHCGRALDFSGESRQCRDDDNDLRVWQRGYGPYLEFSPISRSGNNPLSESSADLIMDRVTCDRRSDKELVLDIDGMIGLPDQLDVGV
jgi:hypothetical protein